MKRLMALLVALMIAVVPLLGEAQNLNAEYNLKSLIVGSTTALSGTFFTDQWGNNTSDLDVRLLLHGYSLANWQSGMGGYEVDEGVVNGFVVIENENGDRTYNISLQRDLYYCDGTPITAKDYAFSILLSMAPEIAAIGGQTNGTGYIVGSDEYKARTADVLAGVRLLSEYHLNVTVKAEYYPFFYELALLDFKPYPINVLAPGCEVKDDGEGVYISGPFSAALLQTTILDPDRGYQAHPMVTSGPYKLVEYRDGEAEFAINDYFKGNKNKTVPTIEHIYYKQADNTNMIDLLKSGEFDLLNKCTNVDTVDKGTALVGRGLFNVSKYARAGLTLIDFCCEKPTVSSQAVRQAIAYCFEKDQFIDEMVGDHAVSVYGYYGKGQWMYQMVNGNLSNGLKKPGADASAAEKQEYEETKAAWNELTANELPQYEMDLNTAARLLDDDGWTLNEKGGAFDPSHDTVRCKNVNGKLVKLALTMICPDNSKATTVFEDTLTENLRKVGITLTVKPIPMENLLSLYYRREARDCDMIYAGTNFGWVFEPTYAFDPADADTGMVNVTAIRDEELYELAKSMRETDPGDRLTYCQKWIAFQQRFAEVLPAIPVYSNTYYDFYTTQLQNYKVQNQMTWTEAIVESWLR